MKLIGCRLYFILASSVVFALPAYAQTKPSAPITAIQVEGNQRVETSAVENYLGIRRGDSPTRYDLDLALKKLYDTGFFSDVSVDPQGSSLKVTVVENPSINEVIFEGNDGIDKKDLEKEVTLNARSIYTRTKVQNDLKRLLDVYRRNGRYSAQITPQIIELPQNRVNLVYSKNQLHWQQQLRHQSAGENHQLQPRALVSIPYRFRQIRPRPLAIRSGITPPLLL